MLQSQSYILADQVSTFQLVVGKVTIKFAQAEY